MANRDRNQMNEGIESVNLAVIPREIQDFRQEQKQLEDLMREIRKTNSRLVAAKARTVKSEGRLQSPEEVMAEMLQEQLQRKRTKAVQKY